LTGRTRRVAVLAGNPAFGAILCRSLEDAGFNALNFSQVGPLTTFLRISTVDTLILDAELPGPSVIDIAKALRSHQRLASPLFEIVTLTRTRAEFHRPFYDAGIDLVLEKPLTPARLIASLNERLELDHAIAANDGRRRTDHVKPRSWTAALRPRERLNNVIELFSPR
jgi:DNA-binding response OmpR family regulator